MPGGLALLRWFQWGGKPPVAQQRRRGRGGKHVAAPPSIGGGGEGALAPVPEDAAAPTNEGSGTALGAEHLAVAGHVGGLSRLQHLLRAVAVPSVQLVGRLLSKPWEPLQEQVRASPRTP